MKTLHPIRRQMILLSLLIVLTGTNVFFIARLARRPTFTPVTVTGEDLRHEEELATARLTKLTPADAAEVVTAAQPGVTEKAELVFAGLAEPAVIRPLLAALQAEGHNAVFFVCATDMETYPESLQLIHQSGFDIGIRNDPASGPFSSLTGEEIIHQLTQAGLFANDTFGVWPTALLFSGESMPEDLPLYARACALSKVYAPTACWSGSETASEASIRSGLSAIRRGSLLCIDLTTAGGGSGTPDLAALITVLETTDLQKQAEALCDANAGKTAGPIDRVYTTERSVAFTFYGLGNEREVDHVLETLVSLSGKAVFFLTPKDMDTYGQEIRSILSAGQDLGIALIAAQYDDTQSAVEAILTMRETLAQVYGYDRPMPLRQAYGNESGVLEEAASATGMTMVTALFSPVRTEHNRETDARAVMDDLFVTENNATLQRGEIVYFQMNLYQKSDALLGDLVGDIAAEQCAYSLGSLMDILANKDYVYAYPLPDGQIIPSIRDIIHPGQLQGDLMTVAKDHYIGNPYYNIQSKMPGFTAKEIHALNKSGTVPNDGHYIFLTFDDWGTDSNITELLDVLKKHGATATFFIRTNNVHYNPNLLRAIALDGHTIGSHTDMHLPLSNVMEFEKSVAEPLTTEQVAALKRDLVVSWDTLEHIIGDVIIDGRTALVPLFRPPTLAVSKVGIEAVFDCGFTYVISGSLTTQDYNAASAEALYQTLAHNTKSGAVFVMIMSDTSPFTAKAVDLYLTKLESLAGAKYQVRGLNVILD